jgi:hypothetical protein
MISETCAPHTVGRCGRRLSTMCSMPRQETKFALLA